MGSTAGVQAQHQEGMQDVALKGWGLRGVQGAAHLLPQAQHVDQTSSKNDTVSAKDLGCGERSGSTANSRWVGG